MTSPYRLAVTVTAVLVEGGSQALPDTDNAGLAAPNPRVTLAAKVRMVVA